MDLQAGEQFFALHTPAAMWARRAQPTTEFKMESSDESEYTLSTSSDHSHADSDSDHSSYPSESDDLDYKKPKDGSTHSSSQFR